MRQMCPIDKLPYSERAETEVQLDAEPGGVISSRTIAVPMEIIKTQINRSGHGEKRTQPGLEVADLNTRAIDRNAQWECQLSSNTSRTTAMLKVHPMDLNTDAKNTIHPGWSNAKQSGFLDECVEGNPHSPDLNSELFNLNETGN